MTKAIIEISFGAVSEILIILLSNDVTTFMILMVIPLLLIIKGFGDIPCGAVQKKEDAESKK